MDKSYEQGVQDGIALYGRVCSKQGDCSSCMIGTLKGDTISCPEFMSKFPSKMVSLLSEMDSEKYTYYNEYVSRFPNCNLPIEALSEIVCRKVVFEGYMECQGGDCSACWQESYAGDLTEVDGGD